MQCLTAELCAALAGVPGPSQVCSDPGTSGPE